MNKASLIFWIICAVPLVAFLAYLLRKDKIKGKWGLLLLIACVLFAIVTIIYITKDFAPKV